MKHFVCALLAIAVLATDGTADLSSSLRVMSAANLTAATANGAQFLEKGPRWTPVTSTPAVSTKASASKSAGAAGVRHVADCIMWEAGASTAPTATALTVDLRDGATGAGTILKSWRFVAPATTGTHATFGLCGLNLVGTAATAMTIEFSALLTNEFQSVSLIGYDVN